VVAKRKKDPRSVKNRISVVKPVALHFTELFLALLVTETHTVPLYSYEVSGIIFSEWWIIFANRRNGHLFCVTGWSRIGQLYGDSVSE